MTAPASHERRDEEEEEERNERQKKILKINTGMNTHAWDSEIRWKQGTKQRESEEKISMNTGWSSLVSTMMTKRMIVVLLFRIWWSTRRKHLSTKQRSFSEYTEWFYGFELNLEEQRREEVIQPVRSSGRSPTYQLNRRRRSLRWYSFRIPPVSVTSVVIDLIVRCHPNIHRRRSRISIDRWCAHEILCSSTYDKRPVDRTIEGRLERKRNSRRNLEIWGKTNHRPCRDWRWKVVLSRRIPWMWLGDDRIRREEIGDVADHDICSLLSDQVFLEHRQLVNGTLLSGLFACAVDYLLVSSVVRILPKFTVDEHWRRLSRNNGNQWFCKRMTWRCSLERTKETDRRMTCCWPIFDLLESLKARIVFDPIDRLKENTWSWFTNETIRGLVARMNRRSRRSDGESTRQLAHQWTCRTSKVPW